MAKTSRLEVSDKKAIHIKETDEKLDETEDEIKDFNEAIKIEEAQTDPILQETAQELNSASRELGQTGTNEVEKKAFVVDTFVGKMETYERELKGDADVEKKGASDIRNGMSGLDNRAYQQALEQSAAMRDAGETFLTDEQKELEGEELKDIGEVKQKRDTTRTMVGNMKSW